MSRNKDERTHIAIDVNLRLNAQETVMLDRLLATGLYGHTRGEVARRLVDAQLHALTHLTHSQPALNIQSRNNTPRTPRPSRVSS